ncbi:MarC family protein [Candidatus Woesearchaeota archaeon]|nr:MarC family protein [Candidatus Woesearchaeota archaeon]
MIEQLLQLVILFFVIFDPPMSFAVFFIATKNMSEEERDKIAGLAVLVAATISFVVLILGEKLLVLLNTNIIDFKIAGGIILALLGVKMVLGQSLVDEEKLKNNTGRAIAALIGTPLLTGPAAITSIILSTGEYGTILTGSAIIIVLLIAAIFLYKASTIRKYLGITAIQVVSTILGLIMLAWGVKFIRAGMGF